MMAEKLMAKIDAKFPDKPIDSKNTHSSIEKSVQIRRWSKRHFSPRGRIPAMFKNINYTLARQHRTKI
jgi:hypothetical protein